MSGSVDTTVRTSGSGLAIQMRDLRLDTKLLSFAVRHLLFLMPGSGPFALTRSLERSKNLV